MYNNRKRFGDTNMENILLNTGIVLQDIGIALLILSLHMATQGAVAKRGAELQGTFKKVCCMSLVGTIVAIIFAIAYCICGLSGMNWIFISIILFFSVYIPIRLQKEQLDIKKMDDTNHSEKPTENLIKFADRLKDCIDYITPVAFFLVIASLLIQIDVA
jgi:hypothetical protein